MSVGHCEKENREPGGNLLLLMGRADWRVNVSKSKKGTEKLFAGEEKSYEESKLVGK